MWFVWPVSENGFRIKTTANNVQTFFLLVDSDGGHRDDFQETERQMKQKYNALREVLGNKPGHLHHVLLRMRSSKRPFQILSICTRGIGKSRIRQAILGTGPVHWSSIVNWLYLN